MRIIANILVCAVLILGVAACSNADQKAEISSQSGPSTTGTSTSVASTSETAAQPNTASTNKGTGEVYEGTISGVISDSMCGKDHAKMGDTGKDAKVCIEKCVTSGAKYVLVDEKGDSYALSDQDKPKEQAGKTVSITGHIDPTERSIHVHSIVSK